MPSLGYQPVQAGEEEYEIVSLEKTNATWSPQEEKRLVKKLDWRLMPCLFTMIILNQLDRGALANSRVQGIEKSLGMTGSQFNTAISIFFVGYITLQIPSNLLLTRVRPSIYLPGCMIAWGILSGATASTHSFTALATVRFLLGFVEAPFFPGALFLLSSWYTKKELATRMSILYSGSLLSGAFGGLSAAAIEEQMRGVLGFESWRWLFIIESIATIAVATSAMFILPDYPSTTRWLTSRERGIATQRVQESSSSNEAGSSDKSTGMVRNVRLALTDSKVWLLAAIILTKTSAAAVTSFIPTLVQTLGYSRTNTLLLVAPPYLFAALCALAVSWSSDFFTERSTHIIVPMIFGFVGFLIATLTMNIAERYLSLFLMLGGIYGSYNVALAWISSTVSRPMEKRSAALAIVNTIGNLAQIYSPYLYLEQFGPSYRLAMGVNCGFCVACIGVTLVLKNRLRHENGKNATQRYQDKVTGDTEPKYML